MKKIFLFMMALAILLSACISSGPEACMEDGECSINEKFAGGCYDCQPDLAVSYVDTYQYGDYETGELVTSVEAIIINNGATLDSEYVKATFTVTTEDEVFTQEFNRQLYSSDDLLGGDLDLQISQNGELRLDFELEENNQQYWIGGQFEGLELDGEVTFRVELEYDDRDQKNNVFEDTITYGVVGESRFLVERDIGDFLFVSSWINEGLYLDSDGVQNEYKSYSASYRTTLNWTSETRSSYASARTLWTDNLSEVFQRQDQSDDYNKVLIDGNVVYEYTSSYNRYTKEPTQYIWLSGDMIVYLSGGYGVDATMLSEYLTKLPSDLSADGIIPVDTDNFFELGKPELVPYAGSDYKLEIVGGIENCVEASEDQIIFTLGNNSKFILEEGQNVSLDNVTVVATNLFVTNIPNESASANLLFVTGVSNNSAYYVSDGNPINTDFGLLSIENWIISDCTAYGSPKVIISVNGVRKTMDAGDVSYINSVPIFVEDLSLQDIPTLSVSANIYVVETEFEFDNNGAELDVWMESTDFDFDDNFEFYYDEDLGKFASHQSPDKSADLLIYNSSELVISSEATSQGIRFGIDSAGSVGKIVYAYDFINKEFSNRYYDITGVSNLFETEDTDDDVLILVQVIVN